MSVIDNVLCAMGWHVPHEDEAIEVYKELAKKHHGEYARTS